MSRHIFFLLLFLSPCFAVDFLFNSFNSVINGTNITFIQDATIESAVVRIVNDSNQFSLGRAFYPTTLSMKPDPNSTILSSFSTSFVFSILPEIPSSPGFGLCFVLSNSTSPPGAIGSQYFGLFNNATVSSVAPLIAIEFDTGLNTEFNDPDGNHIGIDLNSMFSIKTNPAGFYNSTDGGFVSIDMRNGRNVHAWIDFDGANFEINVTVAPVGVSRPSRPTLSYRDPVIANYVSNDMFVGFSASTTTWVEFRRILAWSLSDTGIGASREINTTNLPVFLPESSESSSLTTGAIVGIIIGCFVFLAVCAGVFYWIWRKKRLNGEEDEEDEIQDWELEYWPHRFTYEELTLATNGFCNENLLGSGGFGRVFKGNPPNSGEIAVKCVSHDSKQGLREFMAEISSMGRLQHKNLVQLRGWCRKGNELMLVYDFMPNGSLNGWIFDKPKKLLNWKQRLQVLTDVAEGLNYLHNGWEQVVVHRDIKSSNVLLDSEMRGNVGDFGLAKLHQHGEEPNTTRLVGTLGYLAPELALLAAPTAASDVFSFGVVILEVTCGRRPIDLRAVEDEVVLMDWVREMYVEGRLLEVVDGRIKDEVAVAEAVVEVEMVLKLGLVCCHPDPLKRPTMKDVVAVLVNEEPGATKPADLLNELVSGGGGLALGGGDDGDGDDSSEVALRHVEDSL